MSGNEILGIHDYRDFTLFIITKDIVEVSPVTCPTFSWGKQQTQLQLFQKPLCPWSAAAVSRDVTAQTDSSLPHFAPAVCPQQQKLTAENQWPQVSECSVAHGRARRLEQPAIKSCYCKYSGEMPVLLTVLGKSLVVNSLPAFVLSYGAIFV